MKGKWDIVSYLYNSLFMLDYYLHSLHGSLFMLDDFIRNLHNSFSCLIFIFSAG